MSALKGDVPFIILEVITRSVSNTGTDSTARQNGIIPKFCFSYIRPMESVLSIFITKIEDKNGNVIEHFHTEQVEAMDDITAYKMIELMKGVCEALSARFEYTEECEAGGEFAVRIDLPIAKAEERVKNEA